MKIIMNDRFKKTINFGSFTRSQKESEVHIILWIQEFTLKGGEEEMLNKVLKNLPKWLLNSLFVAVAAIALFTAAPSHAEWNCPCSTVFCDHGFIKGYFCMPANTHGYIFGHRAVGDPTWIWTGMVVDEMSHCAEGCHEWRSEVEWPDCHDFEWAVIDLDDITFVTFGHDCF
jgi:hypothetical protein